MYEITVLVKENREVLLTDKKAGNVMENGSTVLNFNIPQIYSTFNKYLEIVTEDGQKQQTVLSVIDEYLFSYEIPYEFTKNYNLILQLILKKEDKIFKSNVFCFTFGEGLNVTQYLTSTYLDTLNYLMDYKLDKSELSSIQNCIENKLDRHIYYNNLQNEYDLLDQKTDKTTTQELQSMIDENQSMITQTQNQLIDKANKFEVYTKEVIDNLLGDKVDKQEGKSLSTNDFTNYYQTKLSSLNILDLGIQTDSSLNSYMEYPRLYQLKNDMLAVGSSILLFVEGDEDEIRQIFFTPKGSFLRSYNKTSAEWSAVSDYYKLVSSENGTKLMNLPTIDSLNAMLNAKANQSTTYTKAEVNTELAKRVAIVTTGDEFVYGKDVDETTIPFSTENKPNALVRRFPDGGIKVSLSPIEDADAASKKYVDTGINKINKYLLTDATSEEKREVLMQTSDFILNNTSVAISNNNLTMTPITGLYGAVSANTNKIKFKISNLSGTPFLLLGIGATYTGIGFSTGIQRRIVEFTKAGTSGQYTQLLAANTSLVGADLGDDVIAELSGTYIIVSIKKTTETAFTESFRVDLSQYAGATGWLTAPQLGFITTSSSGIVFRDVYKYAPLDIVEIGGDLTKSIFNVYDIANDVKSRTLVSGRWKGKVWNTLGDSFTGNNIYQPIIKNLLGFSIINNYGTSGSTIGKHTTKATNPMSERYTTMTTIADLITVWGGVNDFSGWYSGTSNDMSIPLGTSSDTTNTTFYGALKVLIEGLINKYPTKKIAFILPPQVNEANSMTYQHGKSANSLGHYLKDYVNALKEKCAEYGVPCLDLYSSSGLNELNMTQMTVDGLHPNTAGFTFMAYQIARFLENI